MTRKSQKQTKEELENKVLNLFKDAPNKDSADNTKSGSNKTKGNWILPILLLTIVATISGVSVWQATQPECNIKTNIDAEGNRYYYMPFDPYYDSVKVSGKREKWLCSEEEALDGGWKRKHIPESVVPVQ